MLDPTKMNELIQNVLDAMPEGLKNLPEDVKQHLQAGLKQSLAKMDLVTREEFDVQVKVLAKTREKVEALEKLVEQLQGEQRG